MKVLVFLFSMACICFSVIQNIQAQQTIIKGIVKDNSGEPLPYANIYIEQSTVGTETNILGDYSLKIDLEGRYRLRCSFIGFESEVREINMNRGEDYTIDFSLQPLPTKLTEVTIAAEKDKSWSKELKNFEKYFLGNSKMANDCKILNPYVMDFKRSNTSVLQAFASEPLKIENKSTGYNITYELDSFLIDTKTDKIEYDGHIRFEELKPQSDIERDYWKKNRAEAYNGSIFHFLKALTSNKLKEEGFMIFRETGKLKLLSRSDTTFIKPEDIISKLDAKSYTLHSEGFLRVEYTQKNESIYTGKQYFSFNETSWLKLTSDSATINSEGFFVDPLNVELFRSFGNRRIAKALPINYVPTDDFDLELSKNNSDRRKIDKFFKNLLRYDSLYPKEKVFLSFKERIKVKPGISIYFNADIIAGISHAPSGLSNILYTELLGPDCQLISYGKHLITEGKSEGIINFPDTLNSGVYEIRAYTSWMKSHDAPFNYYSKLLLPDQKQKPDATQIQFRPFSGKLIYGRDNVIFIHTTDRYGIPSQAFIRVFDDQDNLIRELKSDTLGFTKLDSFKPSINSSYYALVNGDSKKWELPRAEEQTLTMGIEQDEKHLKLLIQSKKINDQKIHLIIQSSGIISYFKGFNVSENIIEIDVTKSALAYGINQVSLVDDEFYHLQDYTIFNELNRPADIAKSFHDHENFNDYLYWRSHLSDHSSYILSDFESKENAFENYILSQEWQKINFNDIYNLSFVNFKDSVETGLSISGILLVDDGYKLEGNNLNLLIQTAQPQFHSAELDSIGKFSFENLLFFDTTNLVFSYTEKGYEGNLEILFDEEEYVSPLQSRLGCNKSKVENNSLFSRTNIEIELEGARLLKEVDISAKRIKKPKIKRKNKLYSDPNYSFVFDDGDSFEQTFLTIVGGPVEFLMGRIPGAYAIRSTNGEIREFVINPGNSIDLSSSAIFFYEGISMSARDFNNLDPQAIGRIDVLKGGKAAIYGARGSGGVVIGYAPIYEYGESKSSTISYNLRSGLDISGSE
ncbi:MAG: TonB-dependent receptor [Bacteroidota bacterium]